MEVSQQLRKNDKCYPLQYYNYSTYEHDLKSFTKMVHVWSIGTVWFFTLYIFIANPIDK